MEADRFWVALLVRARALGRLEIFRRAGVECLEVIIKLEGVRTFDELAVHRDFCKSAAQVMIET